MPPLFPRVEEPLMEEAPQAMPDDKPNDKMKEELNSSKKEQKKEKTKEDDNLIEIGQFFETSLKGWCCC